MIINVNDRLAVLKALILSLFVYYRMVTILMSSCELSKGPWEDVNVQAITDLLISPMF